jgi:hypothetical protein
VLYLVSLREQRAVFLSLSCTDVVPKVDHVIHADQGFARVLRDNDGVYQHIHIGAVGLWRGEEIEISLLSAIGETPDCSRFELLILGFEVEVMHAAGKLPGSFEFALDKRFVDDHLRGDVRQFTPLPLQAPPNTFRSSERCPGAGEQSGISVEEMIWILNAGVSGKTQTNNLAGATALNLKDLVL